MSRRPTPFLAWIALCAAGALGSCADRSSPVGPVFAVELDVTFQIADPWADLFEPDEVDRVRAVAVRSASGDTIGSLAADWDPGEDVWSVALDASSPGGGGAEAVVYVELIGGAGVEWSGRADLGRVSVTPASVELRLHRGPVANLDVTGVAVTDAPEALDEGASAQLGVDVDGIDPGALDDVKVYWSSSDPGVATVGADGLVTGVLPGSVSILAVAGPAGDTAVIDVEVVPVEILLDPPTATLTSVAERVELQAAVIDVRGDTIDGFDLLWASTDTAVLEPLDSGVFEAAGPGSAEVVARVLGVDGVEGRATVDVDQVVAAVTVTPSDSVALGPGTTVQFQAEAVDANGHAVAGATFTWSSSDEAVASIDATGLASTLGQGITSIQAEVEGVSGATDLTVLTTPGFSRVWVGGDPDGARDWANQENWLPRLVPTVVDTVLVEASAVDQPRLPADWSVAGLVVEDGASVDLEGFTLTVTEGLDAGSTIQGPGTVRMIGPGASIRGAVPTLVVNGSLLVTGPLDVTGDLTVSEVGSGLDVGAQTVSVTGAMRIQEGATLTMGDPAAAVDVDGDAVFDGASTLGLLTDGELRVGGNFTAWTSEPESFAPTGGHRTVLDGDVVQTVYLHFNGPGEARFQELEVDNPGGVSLRSTVRVTDDVTLTAGTLEGAQTVVIGGDLIEVVGENQYQALNTIFTGSPALPPSVQTNATFTGAHTLTADLEVLGSVTVSGAGAALAVGGFRVSVTGDLGVRDAATLVMQDAAAVLDVAGEAYFDGGSTLGLLSAGELRVGGSFTAWTSDPLGFAPTGSHRTVLDGATAQAVYLHYSGAGESRFHHLELENPAGATLHNTTRVTDDLILTQGELSGPQTMIIGGDLVEVVGGNQHRVLHTTFTGTPALPASLQTNASFTGAAALQQGLEVIGDVIVDGTGADLAVGANTLTVTGALRTSNGGTLTMQDAAGIVDVAGDVEFDGGSTLGLLTDGELRVAGNLTAWTSDPENFAPTGSHLTTLDGATEQTVYMYHSGTDQARFEDVVISNATSVSFVGTVRVTDALTVQTGLTVGAGHTTLVGGLFTLEAAGTLTNDGSVQANACTIEGTVIGNDPVCS